MKAFTIYWVHGERNVIFGETIENAFTNAGYNAGAVKAIDWYDNGVTNTHRFIKGSGWVKYEQVHIHESDFHKFTSEELEKMFIEHHGVVVERDNKDQYNVYLQIGLYDVGWVRHITIQYDEYNEGNYFYDEDTKEGDHYYMVCNSMYFPEEKLNEAIKVFQRYVTDMKKTCSTFMMSSTIDDIQRTQKL